MTALSKIIVLLLILFNSEIPANSVYDLTELQGWQYFIDTTGDKVINDFIPGEKRFITWKSIDELSKLNYRKNGEIIWLKIKLPGNNKTGNSIYLGQVTYPLQVYANYKMIYNLGDMNDNNKYIRWNQVLVNIPLSPINHELIIKIKKGKGFENIFNRIIYASPVEVIKFILQNDLLNFIFLTIFCFMALVTVIIYFFYNKIKLLIILFSLLTAMAVMIFSNLAIVQLYLNAPVLYMHLNYISLGIGAVCIFVIVEEAVSPRYKLLINIVWKVRLLMLVFTILILTLSSLTFSDLARYIVLLTTAGFIISMITIYLSKNNYGLENRTLFGGITAVTAAAILEIIIYFIRGAANTDFGYKINFIPIGILFFVFSFIRLAVQKYIDANEEKDKNKQKALELMQKENSARKIFAAKLINSQENERNRIAFDLHDGIGHKLILIKNKLTSRVFKEFEGEIKQNLDSVIELTTETISEIRDITSNLHPPILHRAGLSSAIETMIEKMSEATGISFNVFVDDIDSSFTAEHEINFYRIVQEAVNNIIKHSHATEAFVKITKEDEKILLEIKDNGTGFNAEHYIHTDGIGLNGMKERAVILGTRLIINSGSNGTIIKMEYKQVINHA